MREIYSTQPAYQRPSEFTHEEHTAIFLVGPTPRKASVPSWRPEAIQILKGMNYQGTVLIPEPESGKRWNDYDNQVDWERQGLYNCDAIVAWVPRDMETMPALTTNVEFGFWMGKEPKKVFYGRPADAFATRYLDWMYRLYTGREPSFLLGDTLYNAVLSLRQTQ